MVSFCASNYVVWVSAYGSANSHELCNVEATFAQLKLRYERLPLAEPLPQLDLRNTGFLPSCHEQFDHSLVEVGTK